MSSTPVHTSQEDANASEGRERAGDLRRVQAYEGPSVEEITRIVGQVSGALSLAIARRSVSKGDVVDHVRRLRLAANLLEQRFLK